MGNGAWGEKLAPNQGFNPYSLSFLQRRCNATSL
jgi:hypothetical protein